MVFFEIGHPKFLKKMYFLKTIFAQHFKIAKWHFFGIKSYGAISYSRPKKPLIEAVFLRFRK